MKTHLLAIDQGTTNSRAIVFDGHGKCLAQHEIALKQYYPKPGWVEHDVEEMFQNMVICCREAIEKAVLRPEDIAAAGISNQRETTVIWDKNTGKPIYPAIVWQDRRTSQLCDELANTSLADDIQQKTGVILDPYFSATKIKWLLDHVPNARKRAENGELLFGTIDTYLLWRFTNGRVHATDATNASRTMIFNNRTQVWDQALLDAFTIPDNILPSVFDNTHHFGDIDSDFLGCQIPIMGMAGDQQAATVGQACFKPGMVKTTYGTGCFMLLNTGDNMLQSSHRLISTIAYRIQGKVTYGLEGSIFCAGVTVKWLRDTLKLIQSASETEVLAASIPDTEGVYLVPAFTGLGAPYWDPEARGALLGLTRNSGVAHLVRACLEAVAYQTCDLLGAMMHDSHTNIATMRVDGGMTPNRWLLQFIADILRIEVERPVCVETSALGAAYLAGLQIGLFDSLDAIATQWRQDASFYPTLSESTRDEYYAGWKKAVARVLT